MQKKYQTVKVLASVGGISKQFFTFSQRLCGTNFLLYKCYYFVFHITIASEFDMKLKLLLNRVLSSF